MESQPQNPELRNDPENFTHAFNCSLSIVLIVNQTI